MAELAAARQGLALTWDIGFKYIQLELNSNVVLMWLTEQNATYPPNMLPLLCDCRNLMEWDWEVRVLYVYREANTCADALAKRGTHQQHFLSLYSSYPNFVFVL